jgi:hypothetical protein
MTPNEPKDGAPGEMPMTADEIRRFAWRERVENMKRRPTAATLPPTNDPGAPDDDDPGPAAA